MCQSLTPVINWSSVNFVANLRFKYLLGEQRRTCNHLFFALVFLRNCNSLLHIAVSRLITSHSNERVSWETGKRVRPRVCVLTVVSTLYAAVYSSHNVTEFSFPNSSRAFFCCTLYSSAFINSTPANHGSINGAC